MGTERTQNSPQKIALIFKSYKEAEEIVGSVNLTQEQKEALYDLFVVQKKLLKILEEMSALSNNNNEDEEENRRLINDFNCCTAIIKNTTQKFSGDFSDNFKDSIETVKAQMGEIDEIQQNYRNRVNHTHGNLLTGYKGAYNLGCICAAIPPLTPIGIVILIGTAIVQGIDKLITDITSNKKEREWKKNLLENRADDAIKQAIIATNSVKKELEQHTLFSQKPNKTSGTTHKDITDYQVKLNN